MISNDIYYRSLYYKYCKTNADKSRARNKARQPSLPPSFSEARRDDRGWTVSPDAIHPCPFFDRQTTELATWGSGLTAHADGLRGARIARGNSVMKCPACRDSNLRFPRWKVGYLPIPRRANFPAERIFQPSVKRAHGRTCRNFNRETFSQRSPPLIQLLLMLTISSACVGCKISVCIIEFRCLSRYFGFSRIVYISRNMMYYRALIVVPGRVN